MKKICIILSIILFTHAVSAFDVSELILENKFKVDRTCTITNFEFANYYDNSFKQLLGYNGKTAYFLSEEKGKNKILVVGDLKNPIWKSEKIDLNNGLEANKFDFTIWKSSSFLGANNHVVFFDHKSKRGYYYSRHINALRWLGEEETRAFKIEFSNCVIKEYISGPVVW